MANLAQQKLFKQVYNAKTQPSFVPNGSLLFTPLSKEKKKNLILVTRVIVVGMNAPSA